MYIYNLFLNINRYKLNVIYTAVNLSAYSRPTTYMCTLYSVQCTVYTPGYVIPIG